MITAATAQGAPLNTPAVTWVPNGQVSAIAASAGTTYIGGTFTQVGPVTGPAVGVDVASGADGGWPQVRGATHNASVTAVAADGEGGWYIGGRFTSVGGAPR